MTDAIEEYLQKVAMRETRRNALVALTDHVKACLARGGGGFSDGARVRELATELERLAAGVVGGGQIHYPQLALLIAELRDAKLGLDDALIEQVETAFSSQRER